MAKEKIPVYHIANLTARPLDPGEFMIEAFGHYLGRQSAHLHHPHRHNFYHLVGFTGGAGTHSIDFVRFPVESGQLYFMAPGQVHSWNFQGRPEGYVINFSAGFLRGFLQDPNYPERFSFFSGAASEGVVRLQGALRKKVFALLGEMLEQYGEVGGGGSDEPAGAGGRGLRAYSDAGGRDEPRGGDRRYMPDLLRAELVQLFLLVQSGVAAPQPAASPALTQQQQLLQRFRRLLDQHYRTKRLPSEYAALLYITPNHLNALCRDLLGQSAGEVIRHRVLLEAKRLLTNAGMTSMEIAYELNFQDNSYFNKFFKKYEGVTPEEFRRKHAAK